jgi:gluconolactonase
MKYRNLLLVISLLLPGMALISCDNQSQVEVDLPQKAISGLDSILPAGAKLENVTKGYEFDTAGSPQYADGDLYFTNNIFDPPEKSWTIKMDKAGEFHVLRKDNGVTTTIQHSGKGTFYCCEMLGHRVIEMDRDGSVIRVVCGEYNGKRVDGPNDIVVDRKGGIYFTDSQFIAGQEKMQETPAVYYVKSDGSAIRVIDDIVFPNGIMLSPDEKTLYIANTQRKYLLAYDVHPDGTVSNGRNFAELELKGEENIEKGFSGADGMAVDSAGNIYVATTQGLGIQVIDSKGNHLGNILCPVATNNCNFGGEDLKTLYVSAKDGIYSIPVKIPGLKQPQD